MTIIHSVAHRTRIPMVLFAYVLAMVLPAYDLNGDTISDRPPGSWTSRLPVVQREPRPKELIAYPTDGSTAGVNPPGFCWTPHDRAHRYRLEVADENEPSSLILTADEQSSTVYAHGQTLPVGHYRWQVIYQDANGNDYGRSKARRFRLSGDLPALPMPDITALKDRLASVRPRLFLTGDRLQVIRRAVQRGEVPLSDYFFAAADAALREGPYAEPDGYTNGQFNVSDWRRIYRPGKVGSAHLVRTALAYKITGREDYLEGARRWMKTLAGWNPTGIISHDVPQPDGSQGNDEASMPVLERMAFAWDWIGDELTPEERALILSVMAERGNQVLRLLKKQDFLSHPFENHEGRVLAFLGNAGLSFLGDIPEAEQWLDYVVRCYLTSFPAWGSDDGGWAQGTSYWGAYVYWLSTFAESLRGVTDTDILRRPFYRNNGYFPLYFYPPYAPMGAFGDGGSGKPSLHEKLLIAYWAEVFHDPLLKWHAEAISVPSPSKITEPRGERQWNEWFVEDVISVLRAGTDKVQPRSPEGGSVSRLHRNIGWAAMHSDFGNAEHDVWVLFKSSRFGSFSHSHADQNTFQLNAYGEALAIDSGYYPSYGSPHHTLWTRQTRAHNGILVNGRGQPPYNWNASGQIESYQQHAAVTIVRGQAAQAYNVAPRHSTIEMWRKHLDDPVPSMEPKVESFQRTVAFVASPTRPVLAVYDHITSDGPTSFDWLLHALRRMDTDEAAGAVTISSGQARLAVRLVATQPLTFSQFGGFPVPPGERAAKSPDQWHLTAHTNQDADEVKFFAIMVPYRADEPEPKISGFGHAETVGFQVGTTEVAVWWGPGESGGIDIDGQNVEGRLRVKVQHAGGPEHVMSR